MKGEPVTPSLAEMAEVASRFYAGLRSQLPLSELRELQPSRESLRAHVAAAQREHETQAQPARCAALGSLRAALRELAELLGELWAGLRGEQAGAARR